MQAGGNTAGKYSDDPGEITARRALVLAFAISLAWHIFWLSSVKLFVSAPPVIGCAGSTVSFVGSILEEQPVMSAGQPGAAVAGEDIKRLRDLAVSGVSGEERIAASGNEKMPNLSSLDAIVEIEDKLSNDAEAGAKQIPETPFEKVMVSYKTYPSEIEGPVRSREVIYKPELPSYLRWDEGLGVDLDRLGNTFSITLKLTVSPEGKVESVERVSSSGHPTVDLVAIRYLKGWQFSPLKSGGSKEEQWGQVKLNFSLNKAEAK